MEMKGQTMLLLPLLMVVCWMFALASAEVTQAQIDACWATRAAKETQRAKKLNDLESCYTTSGWLAAKSNARGIWKAFRLTDQKYQYCLRRLDQCKRAPLAPGRRDSLTPPLLDTDGEAALADCNQGVAQLTTELANLDAALAQCDDHPNEASLHKANRLAEYELRVVEAHLRTCNADYASRNCDAVLAVGR
jgi:hypothetical protein